MTPTTVVNVKYAPVGSYVYVGRAMPGRFAGSIFGNPYKVAVLGRSPVELYREWFMERAEKDGGFRWALLDLAGKRLGCWCAPKDGLTAAEPWVCHGQIIAAWVDAHR